MNRILTAALAAALCMTAFVSAEAQRRSFGGNAMNRNRTTEMNESTKKEWAALQKELAKKDPAGFAEVKKLAETNLPAAFNKMQLLAGKAGLKVPGNRMSQSRNFRRGGMERNGRGGREGREGMGQAGRFRPFGGGRRGMNMPNAGQSRAEAEAKIEKKFPAEYAAYKKTAEDNRVKIRDLAVKTGIKLPANAEELSYVNKKYENELKDLSWRDRFTKLRELLEKEGYEFSFGSFGGGRREGSMQTPRPAPPAKRDFSRNDLARRAKQQYPEEWQEYVELNKKDRNAAKVKLEALLKKVK